MISKDEIRKIKVQGFINKEKYYDRVHDRLFYYNNMLLAGYFVLIVVPSANISPLWIILPMLNMFYLVYVEITFLKKSDFEAFIDENLFVDKLKNYNKRIENISRNTNISFWTTVFTSILFIVQLIMTLNK